MSIPGVLDIYISGHVIALHLDVGGNRDVRPSAHIVVILVKVRSCSTRILCISELPGSVQVQTAVGLIGCDLAAEEAVVRMGRETVLLINPGIADNPEAKFSHIMHLME